MTISVVMYTSPGFEDYTFQLVQALSTHARVYYVLDVNQKQRFGRFLSPEVTILPFRRPRRRHIWGAWEMYRLARRIRQTKADVFHWQGYGLWESELVRLVRPLPVVNTVHDPVNHIDYRTHLNDFLLKDSIRTAQAYVVHSQIMKNVLQRQHRLNSEHILVHPIGVFKYYLNFASTPAQRQPYVLFFGEPRLNKGIDILLQAFHQIRDNLAGWQLVIAGKGEVSSDIVKGIQQLGQHVIHKNYFIPDHEVAQLFAHAGIVVLPYRHATQSGVLPLAAAFGCCVLTTPVGTMPEIVEPGKHVHFVPAGDVDALARGMLFLMRNPSVRVALGQQLQLHANANWSWDQAASGTVRLYEQVLSAK